MENFVVYMDAECETGMRVLKQEISKILDTSIGNIVNGVMIGDDWHADYRIINNRCYCGIKLDYEDPNTAKIWAMISKHNAEMARKYPTIKMSA